jgi:hypothetical protein
MLYCTRVERARAMGSRISLVKSITVKASPFVVLMFCCFVSFPDHPVIAQKFPCTYIELRCPTYIVAGNSGLRFSADVIGARQVLGAEGATAVSYKWEVTRGRIIEGMDTSSILVEPNKNRESNTVCITATVKVNGVEPTCESTKSCSVTIDLRCSQPEPFDQFGKLSIEGEQERLDKLAAMLLNDKSESLVYLVVYAGRTACIGEAESRASKAKAYLRSQYKLSDNRIIAVDGGYRENPVTEVFVVPSGSCGPMPTPTIKTSDAQIAALCPGKNN